MSGGTIEILTGRERRRRWSVEEKLRLVAETQEAGASVKAVAARHDVYPGLLFTWRRQVREGRLTVPGTATFLPVQAVVPEVASGPATVERSTPALSRAPVGRIEIELPDGARVHVDDGVSLPTLRRVLAALRR